MKKQLLLTALSLAAASAHADLARFATHPEQPYLGADLQLLRVDAGDNSVNLPGAVLRAGTNFMPYWGIEAQASIGISNDDFVARDLAGNAYNCTAKNRGSYGVFVKPHTTLASGLNVYGLIGANYNDIKAECSSAGYQQNGYGTAFAAGLGLGKMIGPTMSLNAELMRYDSDVMGINVGGRWFF